MRKKITIYLIGILLILPQIALSETITIGNTNVQTEHSGASKNYMYGSWFSGSDCLGGSINVHVDNFFAQTPQIWAAVYIKTSTTTGTLLEGSETILRTIDGDYEEGWLKLPFKNTFDVEFSEGTDYWLMFWLGEDGLNTFYDTVEDAGGSSNVAFDIDGATFPSSLTISDSNRLYSIYVDCEAEVTSYENTAKFYSLSGDGVVGSGYVFDFDEVVSTSTGLYFDYDNTYHLTDISWDNNHEEYYFEYNFMRTFFPFDTDSLPDDAVISSSTLWVYQGYYATSTDYIMDVYVIVNSTVSSSTVLDYADYSKLTGGNEIGGVCEYAGGEYHWQPIPMNELGRSWIATSGITYIGFRSGMDVFENNYEFSSSTANMAWGNKTYFSESEYGPYLEVWYTTSEEEEAETATTTKFTTDVAVKAGKLIIK